MPQVTVIEVKSELSNRALYRSAIGQCKLRLMRLFAIKPSRTTALAMAIGRDHVEVLYATRRPNSVLNITHTQKLPFSLTDASARGLQHFLAVTCASPEHAGYELPTPPQVNLQNYTIDPGASWVPLKLSADDVERPLSPRGTEVFQVDVRERGGDSTLTCVMKVALRDDIRAEVRIHLTLLHSAAVPCISASPIRSCGHSKANAEV